MTIETVTYIDDLNPSYPASTDAPSEGDDHIRNLKTGIKNTYPNITGAVTATHTELNYLDITTLGTVQASKAVTANGSSNITMSGGTFTYYGSEISTKTDNILVYKDSTENVYNSATAQADNELTTPLATSTSYAFTLFLNVNGSATAGLRLNIQGPTGSTVSFMKKDGGGIISGSTDTLIDLSGTQSGYIIHGSVITSTTAGNLLVSWAQWSAETNFLYVYAGSWLNVIKKTL